MIRHFTESILRRTTSVTLLLVMALLGSAQIVRAVSGPEDTCGVKCCRAAKKCCCRKSRGPDSTNGIRLYARTCPPGCGQAAPANPVVWLPMLAALSDRWRLPPLIAASPSETRPANNVALGVSLRQRPPPRA